MKVFTVTPAKIGDKVLKAKLPIRALLDEVNVHAAAAYKAGVWCKLCWGGGQGTMRGAIMESAEAAHGNGHGWA